MRAFLYLFLPAGAMAQSVEGMWQRFKQDFQRSYSNMADDSRRFAVFNANVKMAFELNAEQGINCTCLFDDDACVFGVTKFADMSEDEFKSSRLGYRPSNLTEGRVLNISDVPQRSTKEIDWRSNGAVTAVKDQGSCGSCWAFSTVEEIESALFMVSGKLEGMSTQQAISCDKKDDGCDGGDPISAYHYLERAGGLDSSSDYPDKSHTTGVTGKCRWRHKRQVKVSGYEYATKPCKHGGCKHRQKQETELAQVLADKGPVSVCVNAGGNGWQMYKYGIYSEKCSGAAQDLDHCVQLVGFDMSGEKPYWIVRNSWNTDWGMEGFMHLEMGKNLCGITNEATLASLSMLDSNAAFFLV